MKFRQRFLPSLFVLFTAHSFAYPDYVPLMSIGTWNNNSNVYMDEWQKHINDQVTNDKSTLVIAHNSDVPAQLAAHYPPEQRNEAERVFRQLLLDYKKIEQKFHVPQNDIAGATAAFVAGSWMAYRNSDFPDASFPALVNQMRTIISTSPAFARASTTEKCELFDQLAIRGMFLATVQMALKQKPNPTIATNIRQAAQENLRDFLKVDVERIQVTPQGIALR